MSDAETPSPEPTRDEIVQEIDARQEIERGIMAIRREVKAVRDGGFAFLVVGHEDAQGKVSVGTPKLVMTPSCGGPEYCMGAALRMTWRLLADLVQRGKIDAASIPIRDALGEVLNGVRTLCEAKQPRNRVWRPGDK